jgi:hypothetical protein
VSGTNLTEVFEKLAAAGIQILPLAEISTHFVFERDGFIALVERRGEAFGKAGAPGLLMTKGMAQLVWRGERALFVAKGWERAAEDHEVAALRAFGSDLEKILS